MWGLGDFFGVNPLWMRLGTGKARIACIPGGVPGIAAYLILWLIVPSE